MRPSSVLISLAFVLAVIAAIIGVRQCKPQSTTKPVELSGVGVDKAQRTTGTLASMATKNTAMAGGVGPQQLPAHGDTEQSITADSSISAGNVVGSLTVRALDDLGARVLGARAALLLSGSMVAHGEVVTNESGECTFELLSGREYTLIVSSTWHERIWCGPVLVRSGARTAWIDCDLGRRKPSVGLAGRFVLKDPSAPASELIVEVRSTSNVNQLLAVQERCKIEWVSHREAFFSCDSLPAGEVYLVVPKVTPLWPTTPSMLTTGEGELVFECSNDSRAVSPVICVEDVDSGKVLNNFSITIEPLGGGAGSIISGATHGTTGPCIELMNLSQSPDLLWVITTGGYASAFGRGNEFSPRTVIALSRNEWQCRLHILRGEGVSAVPIEFAGVYHGSRLLAVSDKGGLCVIALPDAPEEVVVRYHDELAGRREIKIVREELLRGCTAVRLPVVFN